MQKLLIFNPKVDKKDEVYIEKISQKLKLKDLHIKNKLVWIIFDIQNKIF